MKEGSQTLLFQLENLARKSSNQLGFAVDIIENRDNWFCQTKFFNTTTSRLEAHLVFKHTQKPEKLIINAL